MNEIKPLTPSEVKIQKIKSIPPVIITAVNNLLVKKFNGGSITLEQDEIVDEVIKLDNTLTKDNIFDNKWLDFEEIYDTYGWEVIYNKPAFNESYVACFKFKPKL